VKPPVLRRETAGAPLKDRRDTPKIPPKTKPDMAIFGAEMPTPPRNAGTPPKDRRCVAEKSPVLRREIAAAPPKDRRCSAGRRRLMTHFHRTE